MRSRLVYLTVALTGIALVSTLAGWAILLAAWQAEAASPHGWTMAPAAGATIALRWAATWAVGVIAALAALWPALVRARTTGRPWLPFWLACIGLFGWTAAALLPRDGWFAPWPGPTSPAYPSPDSFGLTLMHPASVAPLVLIGLLALATWLVRRAPTHGVTVDESGMEGSPPAGPSRVGWWVARLLVGVPTAGLLALALAGFWAATGDPYIPRWQALPLGPMLGSAALVALTGYAAQQGRWALAPLAFAYTATYADSVGQWSAGGADGLLVGASATLGAMLGAWLLRPAAHAFDRLMA